MTYSFDRRIRQGFSRLRLFEQVLRRTIILFMLGLIMAGFPAWRLIGPYIMTVAGTAILFWDEPPLAWPESSVARARKALGWVLLAGAIIYFAADWNYFQLPHPPACKTPLRVPGVLQRIAICYCVVAVIMMFAGPPARVVILGAILAGYWWMVHHPWGLSPPEGYPVGARPEGILHAWVDAKILGRHIYVELPEPEGIVSTIGGLGTCLAGVLAGGWLRTRRDDRDKLLGLFFAANLAIVGGLWLAHVGPINKKIWTSSYVLLAAGIAIHVLAMCYWLVDVKRMRRWAWPFLVFGTNAILVYFASGIVARILIYCRTTLPDGTPARLGDWARHLAFGFPAYPAGALSLKDWLYQHAFTSHIADPALASLAWAVCYVLFWFVLLIPLYCRRIFLKV
jgi:predicted acyltransferase